MLVTYETSQSSFSSSLKKRWDDPDEYYTNQAYEWNS